MDLSYRDDAGEFRGDLREWLAANLSPEVVAVGLEADAAEGFEIRREWNATLVDLSLNGLLVMQPEVWLIDKTKGFQVTVKIGSNINITMKANWVHGEKRHVGFRVEHIDLDSITQLRRFIELNIGDTELLERQLGALGIHEDDNPEGTSK